MFSGSRLCARVFLWLQLILAGGQTVTDMTNIRSAIVCHSSARHYGAYLYSAIPQEKTNSGQIFEVKYLSELSSFSRLHTPGMLNAFSWHACFMCGLLTISVLFLGNNENSQ